MTSAGDFLAIDDTIAAISTSLGRGGIAIVRLSGAEALGIVEGVFRPAHGNRDLASLPTHTLVYGHIVDGGEVLDEVLVTVMRAPRTYTRQDVVEINCHGGAVAARRVLDAVLRAGARLAEPGEFTRRAFVLGRIDLAQAEAVADLVSARTEVAAAAAMSQLAGHLSARIDRLRADLIDLLACVEAAIDFSADCLDLLSPADLAARLASLAEGVDSLLARSRAGAVLREGLRVTIVGRPNVGKSSLMNALLGHNRVIVTATPGTTRDVVEETIDVRGIPVLLADTAGLRDVDTEAERLGVEMARRRAAGSDLVLLVIDGSEPPHHDDEPLLADAAASARTLVVLNKADLPLAVLRHDLPTCLRDEVVALSAKTGAGLEDLETAIEAWVWQGNSASCEEVLVTNIRHRQALEEARASLCTACQAADVGVSEEFIAHHLHAARRALGLIVGETTPDDILDAVFARFCLGK
jgi:tRNA modification GTPase